MLSFDEDTVSDLHKDAYGFRPSQAWWSSWNTSTPQEKQLEWDRLIEALELSIKCQKQDEQRAIVRFSKRVQSVINSGAKDRETALQWIMEEDKCGGDWEFLCYVNRLPYNFFQDYSKN